MTPNYGFRLTFFSRMRRTADCLSLPFFFSQRDEFLVWVRDALRIVPQSKVPEKKHFQLRMRIEGRIFEDKKCGELSKMG